MSYFLEQLLPEYINYWHEVGPAKFIRVFWFFIFFEFFRYVVVEIFVVIYYRISRWFNREKIAMARRKLRIENPLISIVVPGKNEGKHLYKLVKSLGEQTYQNFELIIVDDGSNDETPIISRDLEKSGLITKVFRNDQRGGKASAANLAYRFSTGDIIVHLDADCSFDRDAIEQVILPLFLDEKIGAVGGNVKVRDFEKNLATTLQAIEYLKTISVGRITTATLGIYKIISGAFGAFRREALDACGGWDIGPGLDGDITVKMRKTGYKIAFEPAAVCLTSVPRNFKILAKQRLRWDKSLVRFRLRKHFNVYIPDKNFSWLTFFALFENVFYNLILNFFWWAYIIDLIFNFSSQLTFILAMNLTLYIVANIVQLITILLLSERWQEELKLFFYIPLMPIYTGLFLRIVRTRAYFHELIWKKSYDDPWNPVKSSNQARANGF